MISAKTALTYKTTVTNNEHSIIADEPISVGGTNQGFTPMELLQVSLASCSSITVRMYATRKKWDVQAIDINVDLMINSSNGENFLRKEVFLTGNLDEMQMNRLLDISKKCPVHKLLEKSIEIRSILKLK
jgi:putative redox protein